MTRKIALSACFVFGLVMFAQYFSSHPIAISINQAILEYWQIVFAFTLLVGIAGYVRHSIVQMKKSESRIYTAGGLAGLFAMPLVAIIWGIKVGFAFHVVVRKRSGADAVHCVCAPGFLCGLGIFQGL